MGKTPGKWIKNLLLGKKSPKSNLANGSEKPRSAKKEELVVSVKDDIPNLLIDPPSQPAPASKVNLESGNDLEELELEQAATKIQAAFRAHQARRAFRTLKGIIRLQAHIRGHLVRRQAVATYSCIWGIVKFQALVRGQKVRSLDNGIQFPRTHMEAGDSEALQLSTYSWMDNPPKFFILDKLLASSPTVLPLKFQYGPEEPNSANVWLERWTHLQVWSLGSREARILIPKSKTKKRNYQAVIETEKARPKRGVKKPSGPHSGIGSSRSTAENDKPKRNVRKAKQNLRKSLSASKEGSPLEVKDLKRSSLSNGSEKATLKSTEKKKDTADSVQIEPEGGDNSESAKKEKDTADAVPIESYVEKDDDEPKAAGTSDKGEDLSCSDVKENGNIVSDNTKPSERRASLPAKIENQDDGHTHSGRKIPSYMAPTASAKARVKGEGSPRFSQEKTEKNGTLRRHSLPSPANGNLSTTTMSPRAHRLLLASSKGSINGEKSFSSSKDIIDKSTRAEWKR